MVPTLQHFAFLRFFCLAFILVKSSAVGFSQCSCDPIPEADNLMVTVSDVSGLTAALQQANLSNGHLTIKLNAGVYQLNSNLLFIGSHMSNLTIRGATGNRDDVFIKGLGWSNNAVTHIFNVAADSFTIADITIGEVYYHPIQVHSNPNDADFFHARNVRFIDAAEQLLKVSGGGSLYVDHGVVECCLFEFSNGVAYQNYTGGIDAHRSRDWMVRDNVFKHIRSPDQGLAEHAIHFWRNCWNTIVERNQIINCDRGIGFGLGNDSLNRHNGGIIRNNFVHTSRDVGIGLEYAPDVRIYHNTVVSDNYSNAIEYRFSGTSNVHIANNLTQGNIANRDNATGLVQSNYGITDLSIFTDHNAYDYHLAGNTAGIVNAALPLELVGDDIDCEYRPYEQISDIGADEFGSGPLTTDVFVESAGISIYPNPLENTFTITGLISAYTIQILDGAGQLHSTYSQNSGTISIDISTLPSGLYFVKIENKQNSVLCLRLILKT